MASHSPAAAAPAQTSPQTSPQTRGPSLSINNRNISVWLVGSVGLLLIGMAVALFDLWFQSFYYASTDNAYVEGEYTQIGVPGAAEITDVGVRTGEYVGQGQIVATLRLLGSSTAPNVPVNYHVKAPRSGVVVGLPAKEGQFLTAGQPVAVITDPDSLWVIASLDETTLRGVKVSQPAEIQITVLDQVCQGAVTEILPDYSQLSVAGQAKARTTSTLVPVRIDLEGDCSGLHPGMSAYVRIKIR